MVQAATERKNTKTVVTNILKRSGIFWALILLCIVASLISPFFLQPKNLINIIRQISMNGIVSIGMTLVILTGGIDLSVGSIVGICSVTAAQILITTQSIPLAMGTSIVLGAAIGSLNGIGITKGKIAPFIMTLGSMTAARGFAYIISNGYPLSWAKTGVDFKFLGQGDFLNLPTQVWLFLILLVIAAVMLKFTRYGRHIYAVGDCKEAARLSGIKVGLVEFSVYAIIGFLCAICALVYISRLDVGEATHGTGLELDAIAMVIIGGTSTAGGEGSVIGTLIGATIIAVIANILNLLGISPFIQQIVKGAIIIFAVLLERIRKK